jgi:hypothetical protein
MNCLLGYKTDDTIYESASIIVSWGCRSESNEALLNRQRYKIIYLINHSTRKLFNQVWNMNNTALFFSRLFMQYRGRYWGGG